MLMKRDVLGVYSLTLLCEMVKVKNSDDLLSSILAGITFWLALDDVDEEIGCIYYVPGSFKQGELPHKRSSALGFSQALIDYTDEMQKNELKMDVPKGMWHKFVI